ncbi:hypothetical protein B0O99DRAFT_690462 [Bisporella sp. PMI_857]|nr:hypothetical protein B0O99DRAFT_690462 [Bisporella sp. PMI_857]
MAGSGMLILLLIIRYALYTIVAFYLLVSSITNWGIIHKYNKWPDRVELPPVVEKSQLLMLVATTILAAWLVATSSSICYWISSAARKTLALFGVIDLICAALILAAVVLQSEYLPATLAGCNNYQGHDAVRAMFSREAPALSTKASKGKPLSPRAMCRSFMAEWIVGIVAVIFYLILAILGIFNPKWDYIKVVLTPFWWFLLVIGYIAKKLWVVLVFIWPPIRWVLVTFGLPFRASWFVLIRIAPGVRLANRARRKWNKRASHSPLLVYSFVPRKKSPESSASESICLSILQKNGPYHLPGVPTSKFEHALNDDKILQAFIRNSHFSDLSRLACLSKIFRRLIIFDGKLANPERKRSAGAAASKFAKAAVPPSDQNSRRPHSTSNTAGLGVPSVT